MIEKEWMRFESTGSIEDYLAYSQNPAVYKMEQRDSSYVINSTGQESENWNGADHYAYRYDTGGNPHRGI